MITVITLPTEVLVEVNKPTREAWSVLAGQNALYGDQTSLKM